MGIVLTHFLILMFSRKTTLPMLKIQYILTISSTFYTLEGFLTQIKVTIPLRNTNYKAAYVITRVNTLIQEEVPDPTTLLC